MRMREVPHSIILWLSIMCLVSGCGHLTSLRPSPQGEGGACRTLALVDSLMWQQPDSAFALLIDFAARPEVDSLDEFDLHYFHLLLSELLYKNYCEQSNRDELLKAVAYFDSLSLNGKHHPRSPHHGIRLVSPSNHALQSPNRDNGLVFLAARAHYINGVGFYERDSVVEACGEYLKTLEIMEETFEDKALTGHEAQFMAYTYNRLGDLFSEQLMMKPYFGGKISYGKT